MVRRVWLTAVPAALAAVVALGACSDDSGGPPPSTPTTPAPGPPPTLPDDVAPGEGALVLGDDAFTLEVVCELVPTTDDASGVTTELIVDGGDTTGTIVTITRQSTVGDVPTVTDTVAVDAAGLTVDSQRVDAGGQLIDLRLPNPVSRLIDVEPSDGGALVRAQGVFGPPQSLADDPANEDGALLFRCPA
jgi:hypothetical protein